MRRIFPSARRAFLLVEVTGDSMLPALRSGDLLLVRRCPGSEGPVRTGDIVVARHPHHADKLIIKRIVFRTGAGWWLESDNQRAAGRQDSWDFDAVPDRLVVGRPVVCYWPPSRWSLWARREPSAEGESPGLAAREAAGTSVAAAGEPVEAPGAAGAEVPEATAGSRFSRWRARKAATLARLAQRSEQ